MSIARFAALKLAGLSCEQIVAVLEAEEAERLAHLRERKRINQRNYRARKAEQDQASRDHVTGNNGHAAPSSPSPSPSSPTPPITTSPSSPPLQPQKPSVSSVARAKTAQIRQDQNDLLAQLEPQEPQGAAPQAKPTRAQVFANRKTCLRDDFELTLAMRAFAQKEGWGGERVLLEGKRFAAHYRGHGIPSNNWQALWEKWVLNEIKFDSRGSPGRRGHVDHTLRQAASFARAFERDQQQEENQCRTQSPRLIPLR